MMAAFVAGLLLVILAAVLAIPEVREIAGERATLAEDYDAARRAASATS